MKSSSEARNRAPQPSMPPVPTAAVSSPPAVDTPGPSLPATTQVDADAVAGLEMPSGSDEAPLSPWLAAASDDDVDEDASTAPKKAAGKLEMIDDRHNDAPLPPAQASARHEALEEEAGSAPTKTKGRLELIEDNEGVMPLVQDEEMGKTSMMANKGKPRGESPTRLGLEAGQGRAPAAAPSPPVPQAGRRIEHTPGGARQRPREEVLRRLPHRPVPPPPDADGQLDPPIHIPEATLVEEEPTPPLAEAVPVPDPLPVPWWKRHQKCLMGVSAAILVALSVALGVVLSRGDPPMAPTPSGSNSTAPKSNSNFYADGPNRICTKDGGERPDDESGANFYPTIAECCKNEFWHLRDDECMMNSFGMTHIPSSVPSSSPSTSDTPSLTPSSSLGPSIRPTSSSGPSSSPVPTSEPSSIPSVSSLPTLRPTLGPSTSLRPTSSPSMTFSPSSIPSTRPTTQIESSALQLVTSEDVAGGHLSTENVAVQGDIAVVGAPNNDNRKGAAFVLKRDETGWSEAARIEAPDREEWDWFGWSVAIDGDMIIIGAQVDDGTKGSVHVFAKIDDSWCHQARLVAPNRNAGDYFGFSVGIYQNRVVVGAWGDDSNGNAAGAAYVFARNDTTWTLEAKLLPPNASSGDRFGHSVGIFEHTIVVGAPREDAGATRSGAAHVYSLTSGETWEHRATLSSPDGAYLDYFGWSVGIHGNRVIVGAPFDDSNGDDAGASFIFSDEGLGWNLDVKLLGPDGTAYDHFGQSVAIFGGTAVVGSPVDDDNGSWSGSVHLFDLTRGAWSRRAELLAPDRFTDGRFGHSVAVHNGTVIAHSPGSGETFAYSG